MSDQTQKNDSLKMEKVKLKETPSKNGKNAANKTEPTVEVKREIIDSEAEVKEKTSPENPKKATINEDKNNNDGIISPAEPYVLQIDTTDTFDLYIENGKPSDEVNNIESVSADESKNEDRDEFVIVKSETEDGEIKEVIYQSITENSDKTQNDNAQENKDTSNDNGGDSESSTKKQDAENDKSITDKPSENTNDNEKESKSDEQPKSKPPKDNAKFIWVFNITRECKASDLKMHLSKFGHVTTAKVVTDGKQFYGYAMMEKAEDVNVCIKNLDGTYFEGKKINVSNKGPETIKDASKSNISDTKSVGGRSSTIDRPKSEIRRKPTPTLQNKSPKSRRHRSDMVREMELLKRRLMEEERRREERRREERMREKEREERKRMELEYKLRDARKKLEAEREAYEREKVALIKLQKVIAEEERNKLKREKDNLKKEFKSLEAGFKRRKSEESRDYDRKKGRIEIPQDRRKSLGYKDESWRYDEKKKAQDDYKYKREYYSPKTSNKINESYCVSAPPPPKLTEDFNYRRSDHSKNEHGASYIHRMDMERRDDRKPAYPDHRDLKKIPEKRGAATYQSDYSSSERKMPKYPSTIGGFPNGKPDFMEPKHYGKQEPQRSMPPNPAAGFWKYNNGGRMVPDSMYEGEFKPEIAGPNTQRYHGHPFPGPNYGMQPNVPGYYPQEARYEYHTRKY